ncbi:MAG TPA: UDP-4-amino-4,6-dideoxy-N-acetyl-beta-L-altrosamine N-acetyltransferase [Stenomitos sp.]
MSERYLLRPMADSDLERVLAWRNSERIRTCMFTDQPIALEAHRAWWDRAKSNPQAEHLVFERDGLPLGVVNVTQIDRHHGRCSWGFYIGEAEAPRGSGTVMGILALDHIFHRLGVRKLCAEVLGSNAASLGYHLKLGFKQEGRLVRHVLKGDRYEDVVLFAHFAADWAAARPLLAATHLASGDNHE